VALGILCIYGRAALTCKVLVIVSTFPLPSNNKDIQSDKKSLSRFLQRTQKTIQLILPFNLALCTAYFYKYILLLVWWFQVGLVFLALSFRQS